MWAREALKGAQDWGKGGISKVVPPLLPKGTLEGQPAAVCNPMGRTLHSTGICCFLVFFWGWGDLG